MRGFKPAACPPPVIHPGWPGPFPCGHSTVPAHHSSAALPFYCRAVLGPQEKYLSAYRQEFPTCVCALNQNPQADRGT
eukprot:217217-Alexandrium_andersonii.AAC.1